MDIDYGSIIERGDSPFINILRKMNDEGGFKASFIVDAQGFPVATVTNQYDTEIASVMVSQVRNAVEQLLTRINMADAEEVTTRGKDRTRLISRFFTLGDEGLILVVVAPPGCSYRRLTNQAIRAIEATWST